MIIYVSMVIAGLSMIGLGFWSTYNSKRPLDITGAVLVPAGLAVVLTGVLLICVPGFFAF